MCVIKHTKTFLEKIKYNVGMMIDRDVPEKISEIKIGISSR